MKRYSSIGSVLILLFGLVLLSAQTASAGQQTKPRIRLPGSRPPATTPTASLGKLQPCCEVIAVHAAENTISVRDKKTGRVFKMYVGPPRTIAPTIPGKVPRPGRITKMKQYRPGQTVYMNSLGNRAAVTGFPINATKRDKIGASSRKMETTIIVSSTGRIDGTTKTWTAEALRGFTGGVLVGITDLDGNVLHTTKMRKYGVDGTAKPGGGSSRTEHWSEEVPKEALDKAAAVVIWHSHQPKNRFPGAAAWVVDNWGCIVEVYKMVQSDDTEQSESPDVWSETTGEETKELLSKCKNLFD